MYDVLVAGLGGMGSAVLARSALSGARVIGIEQFGPAHDLGASSGKTRMIRQAYFEDPAYVPLLLAAYERWYDLEQRTNTELLRKTGLLMTGTPESAIVTGSSRTARQWNLPVEHLSGADIRRRFPSLAVHDGEVAVFEREGGVVFPERAIRAHLDLAKDAGAEMRFQTSLLRWEPRGDCLTLSLSGGDRVQTRALVLTMGPWLQTEFRSFGVPLEIQRNVQVWFAPRTRAYDAGSFPSFLLERDDLPGPLYGFPDFGEGVKAAFHGLGTATSAGELDREIDAVRDVEPVAAALEKWMPGAAGEYRTGKACMYSLTPDRHFVIDVHPRDRRVVLLGGFSGHGFKFASVIGEIGADLALGRPARYDTAFLSLRRFAK